MAKSFESGLFSDVVDLIVESVNLHHVDKATLKPETTLTQEGLGLDSVDVLEVVVAVEKKYGVKIKDAETGKRVFQNLGTIVQFIKAENTHGVSRPQG